MSNELGAVYTHDEAARIVELFENILDAHDISVPSPEDAERDEGDTRGLYGSTYSGLLEDVEDVILVIINRIKAGADIITDEFSGAF